MRLSGFPLLIVAACVGCVVWDDPDAAPDVEPVCEPHASGDTYVFDSAGLVALAGCSEIEGNLTLAAGTELSLLPLQNLVHITGDLVVLGPLTDLEGLGNLQTIGGSLLAKFPVPHWTLPSLSTVGVDLLFDHSVFGGAPPPGAIETIALPALIDVGGDVLVRETNVTGLSGLTALESAASVTIMLNHQLTSLDGGLSNLVSAGTLSIDVAEQLQSLGSQLSLTALVSLYIGETGLESLEGFESLTSVASVVSLRRNPAMTSLHGLESLQVSGVIYINDVPITSLAGLSGLEEAGGLSLSGTSLVSLSGLGGVGSMTFLSLWSNPTLVDVSAVSNVSLGGVDVVNNAALQVVSLDVRNGSNVRLLSNPSLTSFSAASLTTSGYLTIEDNDALVDLDFSSLANAATVYVIKNSLLPDLAGLSSLRKASYYFVSLNPALVSIGAEDLEEVSSNFIVAQNASLSTIGFGSLAFLGGPYNVQQNPMLPTCRVVEVRDQVLSSGGIVGLVTIAGNDDAAICP